MNIFDKDGRLLIPLAERKAITKKREDKVRYINGTFIKSGDVIRHIRLNSIF